MCEWLSCEEWCDVFLLCGGRMFSAHRAVLASVSKFLRKVLLSCPYDETPAFIVMPEFDFEIMSSAMHYIYNGEVVVGKHQLDTFLDIMNALQIFVDTRNLLKVSQFNKSFCIDNEEHTIKESIVPAYLSCEDENIVTLKKEAKKECNIKFWNDNINPAQSTSDSDCFKSKSIWAGYLKSLGDRQRRPFSRDLFIETYCLNRNGNGVTEGVLAISNERYQEPASVSKTNANVENLSEIQHETSHKNTENNLNSIYKSTKPINTSKKETYKNFDDISIKNNTDIGFDNFYKTNLLRHIQGDETLEKYMDQELKCYSINNNLIRSPNNFVLNTNNIEEEHSRSCEIGKDFNKNKEAITRVTILNEVLQCPWRPRLPDTFSPFPKNSINLRPEKAKNLQVSADITQEEHMKGHNSTGYTCTECRKSFSQLRNYKYHMSVHRGTKEFATTCPVCGKFFNDKGYLSSHMKIHRNRKEYKCSVCPKSFNQRVAYNMHVRIHTGVKPHVCEECGKAFSRKMLLKQHQRTHSGERPYECPHCSKRFADRSNMTLHLRLHTGIKPFTCSLCPKSFTKKHHLKSHLNFHTGDKPYICPRCKLAFTQSSNMRTHMKKCNVYLEEYQ